MAIFTSYIVGLPEGREQNTFLTMYINFSMIVGYQL